MSRVSRILGSLALLALFTCAGAVRARAQSGEPISVISLDQGSCWLQHSSEGFWDIRSTNDSRCFFFGGSLVRLFFVGEITAGLRAAGFTEYAARPFEAFVHCGGAGALLLLGFPEVPASAVDPSPLSRVPLCMMAVPSRSGHSFESLEILANPEPMPGSACNGADPSSLIFKMREGQDANALLRYLQTDPRYAGMFSGIESVSERGRAYQLKFEPAWKFRLTQAKALLDADPRITAQVEYFEYNYLQLIVGENFSLGTYPYEGLSPVPTPAPTASPAPSPAPVR